MLIINKKLSKKGFSLIELMVAVVILVLAVLGIFLAFSNGWMGMANARDRTVATNYAREAMENVKNMDFEKIITTTKSVTNASKKYRVDVNVLLEDPNLKKVLTVVSWKDRKGIIKTVDTTMLVQYLEVFASDPAKIVLFAESYNILNTFTASEYEKYATTELTAVIKDINGNTIIDWGEGPGEGNVTFLITSTDNFGTFSNGLTSIEVEPINGRATTTFTSNGTMSGNFGLNVIEASVDLPPPAAKTVTDTTTVKITNGPVKIKVEADPLSIKASTTNYSTITVSLIDATGQTLAKKNIFNDVEISLSVYGEGNLTTSTITIPFLSGDENDASATVTLNSTGNPGLVNVIATSDNLGSGKIDVKFLGPPVAISISANPNPMYVDDDHSTIYVSLIDENGFITSPSTTDITINLSLDTDTNGDIVGTSLLFASSETEFEVKTSIFSGHDTNGTAVVTASGGGFTDTSVTINIYLAIIPEKIVITATSLSVKAGLSDSSIIKATIYDGGGKIVKNYNGNIEFTISDNTSSAYFLTDSTVPVNNGFAQIEIVSSNSGKATVNIENPDPINITTIEPSEGMVIGFYSDADHIILTAIPESVKADGISISTITATVYDENYIVVTDYDYNNDKPIDYYVDGIFFSTNHFSNGKATITLSSESAGTFSITAFPSDESLDVPEGVEVHFYEETTIELVEDSAKYYPADFEVVFEVQAIGEDILIDSMGISWVPNAATERFQKIVINSEEVYTGNSLSGAIVDVVDKTLVAGEIYSVELTFGKDVDEKEFIVTFYPYLGSYPVSFSPTTQ